MMTSLYTGVTAMSTNQMKIDVISNNIANANTVGYKYQSVNFADSLNQQISGATSPTANSGGINPKQVGLGVGVSSVSTITTMGSLQYTGNSTDMAISGDGYFVVANPEGGYNFTRAGNFGVDASGNLVTADGYMVCGWQDATIQDDGSYIFETSTEPEGINIYTNDAGESTRTIAPTVTSEATLSGNLNTSSTAKGDAMDDIGDAITVDEADADYVMPMTVVDNLGAEHQINTEYYNCYSEENADGDMETSFYWRSLDEDGNVLDDGYVKFDDQGQLITDEDDFATSADITVSPGGGTNDFTFAMDFSSMTMYGSESNVLPTYVNGNTAGELMDFSMDANGVIMGVYSNGQQQPLGVLSLATFSNPAGLEKAGGNMYSATTNSGDFTIGNPPGIGGSGQLSVGTLEMSNVDLSREYSELIVAQRGYQASSSIISTVDELLQELINLKR